MPKVLITGASGFLGRQVLASLVAGGADVIAVGRGEPPGELSSGVQWRRLDLLRANQEELQAVCSGLNQGLLLHLAWEMRHGIFWTSRTNLDWLAASIRLCRTFIEAGGSRIVAAGTCVEYDAPDQGPCIEGVTPIRPKQLYGVTKDALRRVLSGLQETGEISFAWARIFFLFGPWEKSDRLVPSVVDALLEGREALCGSGRQVRDFMDVRDCGAAIGALAKSDITGEVNIGSGKPVTVADVVKRIGALMRAPQLIRIGALPDRPDEPTSLWADTRRLTDDVGFGPIHALDAGLLGAIKWRRAAREKVVRKEMVDRE